MDCTTHCMNEHLIKRLEDDIETLKQKNSADHKEFYGRLEKVSQDYIESKSDRDHMREKIDKIDNNVEILMQKPAKNWDSMKWYILTAIMGALIGYIMNGVFPV